MAVDVPQNWVTIKDQTSGLQIDFPRHPLELTFEIPFQNTPPSGIIHLYSVPTQTGILVAGTFTSSELNNDWLKKEKFHHFFEKTIVPHFFYNPEVFKDHQTFTFESQEILGKEGASFQVTYKDHDVTKKLSGMTLIFNNMLFFCFYVASAQTFDQKMFEHFIDSVKT